MFETITDPEERGQVGIGTLIVFIAMVLVAAIAAGVLINTAGFLQSSAEQTGEESQKQVTNQLQVVGTTGIVESSSDTEQEILSVQAADTDATGTAGADTAVAIDDGDTVTASANGPAVLTTANIDGDLEVGDGAKLQFELADDDIVTVTNLDTSEFIEFSVSNDIDVKSGSISFVYTFDDTITENEVTVSTELADAANEGSTGDEDYFTINSLSRSQEYVHLIGDGTADDGTETDERPTNLFTNGGEEVSVTFESTTEDGESETDLAKADLSDPANVLNTIGLSDGDTLRFTSNADDGTYTVENLASGGDLVVASNEQLGLQITDDDGVATDATVSFDDGERKAKLKTPSISTSGSSGSVFFGQPNDNTDQNYFGKTIVGGATVNQVEILVASAPGAGDIDMTQTVIDMNSPTGSYQLVYSEDTIQNSEFAVQAVQDDDETHPVLTSGDRFKVVIDPGRLEPGTTTTLSLTTPSGATKSMQVRVPDSLANQESVSL